MSVRDTRTTFAACALPVLLLLAQGGACVGGGTAAGNNSRTTAQAKRAAGAGESSDTPSSSGEVSPPTNTAVNGNGGAAANPDANERTGGAPMNDGQKSGAETGTWGGVGVRLALKEGESEIEFDCAHGTLGEVVPGREGAFSVGGTFVRERGGPVRGDAEPERIPARYSGEITGETMTLRVSAEGVGDLDFTLTRGRAGRLRKCL